MLFHSFDYLLFLLLVFVGYWSLEPGANHLLRATLEARPRLAAGVKGLRTALLLGASFLFYMSWNSVFLVLIVASTLVDFLVGLALGRARHRALRALLLAISLVANLGLLFLFKYGDFGLIATRDVLGLFGVDYQPQLLNLILPVGISFYTFQTLSYTIDVYRRKLAPTSNLLEFATYVAFFPQLVAGPIVRASEFLHQFDRKPGLSTQQAQSAIYLIARGLIKKVAIADVLHVGLIQRVFDDPGAYSSTEVWIAVFAYTWQLYADFSGYTDVARGSARLFGFELPENFDRPFNTVGPIEFWRHWHMTLSRWVQDYIYIPLGGSRLGSFRTYANLFTSFVLIGVWHGAGWNFVIFGVYHALGVTLNRLLRAVLAARRKRIRRAKGIPLDAPLPELKRWQRTALVALNLSYYVIHWPIFAIQDLDQIGAVYAQMFAGTLFPLRLDPWVGLVIVLMTVLHYCPRHWVRRTEGFIEQLPWPLMALFIVAVATTLMVVASSQAPAFIYYQF
jgi:alginate O-acetyltransferase complex protein AlgI